jgi:FixJ family two-component response regulator
MSSQTNEQAIVHVVDDDASICGALQELFDSVGLDTHSYAAARDFLTTRVADRPGCIVEAKAVAGGAVCLLRKPFGTDALIDCLERARGL